MSGGFTPFDKNSYRESKRRRKQALIEDLTREEFFPCQILAEGTLR